MATTTNYGWTTPDDTNLVKDGAAAIRTLGSSIDTTTKNLNPETTLGDIAYRSATANTNTRLAIGTTGQVLTVAGGVPTWSSPATTGFVGCNLTRNSNLNVNSSTNTAVGWNVEFFDSHNFHDNATNNTRITIPTGYAGRYLFTYQLRWGSNSTGFRSAVIGINGTAGATIGREDNLANQAVIMNGSFMLNLVVGDYVELFATQNSGATIGLEWEADTQLGANLRFGCQFLGA